MIVQCTSKPNVIVLVNILASLLPPPLDVLPFIVQFVLFGECAVGLIKSIVLSIFRTTYLYIV